MSKRLHVLFAIVCFGGFAVSFAQLLAEDSRTFTAEQALVHFLQYGLEFQFSGWLFFTIGFLLCTVFWFRKVLRWRFDSHAEPDAAGNSRPAGQSSGL
jgi:hypothetical protein